MNTTEDEFVAVVKSHLAEEHDVPEDRFDVLDAQIRTAFVGEGAQVTPDELRQILTEDKADDGAENADLQKTYPLLHAISLTPYLHEEMQNDEDEEESEEDEAEEDAEDEAEDDEDEDEED